MKRTLLIILGGLLLSLTASSEAGLFKKFAPAGCDSDECAASCDTACCEPTCCPDDYRCEVEVSTETIEKKCYNVDAKPICIPPITTSPFDCFRQKLLGKDACDAGCCEADCCDTGCDSSTSGGGLFSCFKKGCGRIRCVNKLSSEKYEAGEKCVCEWKAVPKCGGDCCQEGCCESCDSSPTACCPTR